MKGTLIKLGIFAYSEYDSPRFVLALRKNRLFSSIVRSGLSRIYSNECSSSSMYAKVAELSSKPGGNGNTFNEILAAIESLEIG